MERFLHFLILHDLPGWLERKGLLRLLPASGTPSIVSFRSWIALVDESTINAMCPPEPRCYSDDVRELADRVLRDVYRELSRLSEYHEGWDRRLLDRLDNIIEGGLRRIEPVRCTEFKNLGCFIPASERGGSREPEELRQYPGPLILVNMERIESYRSDLANRYDDILDKWDQAKLGEYLLEAIIAHEVTHAYTDLAHGGAPAEVFKKHKQRLYYEVIEESLATYYGLAPLLEQLGLVKRIVAAKLLSRVPIEYRAGYAWHTMAGRDIADGIIERWITGTSLGRLETVVIMSFPFWPLPKYYLEFLLEYRRWGRYPALVFEELPITLWKILALELIRLAKPDLLKIKAL